MPTPCVIIWYIRYSSTGDFAPVSVSLIVTSYLKTEFCLLTFTQLSYHLATMLSIQSSNVLRLTWCHTTRNLSARTLSCIPNDGKRVEGEKNMKKHYDCLSTAPSSAHSAFDPTRNYIFPVDPKSNPDDYAPYEEISGDYNRSGMRSIEYCSVDKKEEPYSPPGGEHRYGGMKRYEWSAERLERESRENGKTAISGSSPYPLLRC